MKPNRLSILTAGILASVLFSADSGGGGGSTGEPVAPAGPSPHLGNWNITNPVVEVIKLPIKDLILTAGTQARVTLDQNTIKEYAEVVKQAIKDEVDPPFPPVVVFRDPTGRCILADGFQRTQGHKEAKAKEIICEIREGTDRDAILYSVGANETHGVRRNQKDKQRAVKTLLSDPEWAQWGNGTIAALAKVSEFMVRDYRKSNVSPAVRKTVRKGKVVTVDTANIGKGKGESKSPAKKAGKGKSEEVAKTPASGSPAAERAKQEHAKLIGKISAAVGEKYDGDKAKTLRDALEADTLNLSAADIRIWAESSPKRIASIYPLVIEQGWKPRRAYDFIDREIEPDTKLSDLITHAKTRGGSYTLKLEGWTIAVSK